MPDELILTKPLVVLAAREEGLVCQVEVANVAVAVELEDS